MAYSPAEVVETIDLGPRIRRLVLDIDDPTALSVAGAGDSAVGVYFPGPDGTVDPDGSQGRNYSVRRQDGTRITIDVVLHAHGPGTEWAAAARAGDRVGLDHARSWYRPPADTRWQLLVADRSGLPAAARILEDLPDGAAASVIVEVLDRDELDYLPRRRDVPIRAHVGGNGHSPSTLARAVRAVSLPAGPGYCWFAGEAAESRAVRRHLRGLGWGVDRYDVTGYWRRDSEAWDARFAEVADDVLAVYERALTAGKGDKAAFEEFDDACARMGL